MIMRLAHTAAMKTGLLENVQRSTFQRSTFNVAPVAGSFTCNRSCDDDPEANIVAPVIRREMAAAVGGARMGGR